MRPLTRLKLLRLQAGLLQLQVAQRSKIARARLSEIECGYVDPRPDELRRIAQVLGVPIEQLREPAAA